MLHPKRFIEMTKSDANAVIQDSRKVGKSRLDNCPSIWKAELVCVLVDAERCAAGDLQNLSSDQVFMVRGLAAHILIEDLQQRGFFKEG